MMPAPSVSNPLIRLTKMFGSLVCFRSIPGLEKSLVLAAPRFVVSTIMLSALLSGVAVHPVHAQTDAPIFNWQGEVQVSPSTLMIREGEALTYNIRLSEQPAADGWWVRIHVDGVVYIDGRLAEKGIRWVPSVGWAFNRKGSSGPTKWRSVRIEALQDDDDEDEFVTITHDVWDENTNCPPSLHGVAPVEVQVTDDETASTGVRLSVNPTAVIEGAGGTPVTVRAALNGAPRTSPTAEAVGTPGDSATEGTDYATVGDLTVTIPAESERDGDLHADPGGRRHRDETITVSGTTRSGLTLTPALITDDDERGVTVTPTALTLTEGGDPNDVNTYTVVLRSEPTGPVSITLAVTGDSDVTASTETLRFTTSNWDMPKTVTMSAAEDPDTVEDTDGGAHAEWRGLRRGDRRVGVGDGAG